MLLLPTASGSSYSGTAGQGGVGALWKCNPEPRESHDLGAPRCSEGLDWKQLVQHKGVSNAAPQTASPTEVS